MCRKAIYAKRYQLQITTTPLVMTLYATTTGNTGKAAFFLSRSSDQTAAFYLYIASTLHSCTININSPPDWNYRVVGR